jgi:hypothetical protein
MYQRGLLSSKLNLKNVNSLSLYTIYVAAYAEQILLEDDLVNFALLS